MPAVSGYLRVLRDAKGWSQEEAAVRGGVSSKTLGRWEKPNNNHEPGVFGLKKVVQALGGSAKDAVQLLIRDNATEEEGRAAAAAWLALTPQERERVDSILTEVLPEDMKKIIAELRLEYRDDRGLVDALRTILLSWRSRDSDIPRQ